MNRDFPQQHTGEVIVSGYDWLPHLCECGRIGVVWLAVLTHTNTQTCTVCTFTQAEDYLARWDWEPQCWKRQRMESGHLTLTFVWQEDVMLSTWWLTAWMSINSWRCLYSFDSVSRLKLKTSFLFQCCRSQCQYNLLAFPIDYKQISTQFYLSNLSPSVQSHCLWLSYDIEQSRPEGSLMVQIPTQEATRQGTPCHLCMRTIQII